MIPCVKMLPRVAVLLASVSLLNAQSFPDVSSVYVHYSADNSANVTVVPMSQAFTSANVDLANQLLTGLPDLGFPSVAKGYATPVYFSTTGTLPAPLQANTPYYVVGNATGGYKVYPIATDADASYQPGSLLGEKVQIAQNAYLGVRNVVFTNGGSGTHTLSTKKLLTQLNDLTANGFHSIAPNITNKHAMLELDTDASGHWYFKTLGAITRENMVGSYNGYGPTYYQSGDKYAARQHIGNKRVVYQIFVCRVRSYKERQVLKVLDTPAHINTSTDQVSYGWESRMTSKVATGDLIRVQATSGSTLPAPLVEGTDYFARKVDTKLMTLHPTAADAASGTNTIDLTTTGSGSFLFYDPLRVGDARRWSFFAEVLEPGSGGGNTLSARLQEPMPSGASVLKIPTAFSANGNVTNFASVPDLTPVVLWVPPGATLPPPLVSGTRYWISKSSPTSSSARLHSSLASAQAGVGKAVAASGCITFTAAGTGECLVNYDDDATYIGYGTLQSAIEPPPLRVTFGDLKVLVFKIDFNDPDPGVTNAVATLGVNEAVTSSRTLTLAKGNTPAAVQDSAKAWTLFNSAQGHVPIDLDCYEIVFGSTESTDPSADIEAIVDYLKAKYDITDTVPAPAAPTGAAAIAGDGLVSLSWTPVIDAASYRVKVASSPSGPFSQLAQVDSSSRNYLHLGLASGVTYYYKVSAVNAGGESADSATIQADSVNPPALTSAVSRRVHGTAGSFDLPVSISPDGTVPVECRLGSALTLVATFDKDIATCDVVVASGAASLGEDSIVSGREVTVSLTDVTDMQALEVDLENVTATDGGVLPVGIMRVKVLVGDVNGSSAVNVLDAAKVKSVAGKPVAANNYWYDIDANGELNSLDTSLTTQRSGNSLP
ncbi:MAG: hypothetical protein J0I10_18190 [Verrucomicrobia bacterium]|nr:hypothetical protein [Verrucomicrobiota bacterium]